MNYNQAMIEFNNTLIEHPIVEKLAKHHERTVNDVVEALQCRLRVLRYRSKKIKSISINFKDSESDIGLRLSKNWKTNQ